MDNIETRTDELKEGSKLNQGELDLYFWQYNKLGGFMTGIFNAMTMSDNINLNKLSMGFPEQVQAYKNYTNMKGFWEQVKFNIEQ